MNSKLTSSLVDTCFTYNMRATLDPDYIFTKNLVELAEISNG